MNNPLSYQNARKDVLSLIEKDGIILDVGCNNGSSGNYYKKNINSNATVYGVDYNPEAIQEAKICLDNAEVLNLNDLDSCIKYCSSLNEIDTLIFADVLEHLIDPLGVLNLFSSKISKGGHVIISIPNSGFYLSYINLISGKWPRNERGIYDKTHTTIFLRNNLSELIPNGFELCTLKRNLRLLEGRVYTSRFDRFILPLIGAIPIIRELFTFQYIIKIEKR